MPMSCPVLVVLLATKGMEGRAKVATSAPHDMIVLMGSLDAVAFAILLHKGIFVVIDTSSATLFLGKLLSLPCLGVLEASSVRVNRFIPLTPVSRALTNSLWRVKAGLHTIAQVSVGAVVGASDAALWYWFSKAYFTSQVNKLSSRELTLVTSAVTGGYQSAQRSMSSFKEFLLPE